MRPAAAGQGPAQHSPCRPARTRPGAGLSGRTRRRAGRPDDRLRPTLLDRPAPETQARRKRGGEERTRLMQAVLDGLIVLDLTNFLSGPYCTMLLGDMGA